MNEKEKTKLIMIIEIMQESGAINKKASEYLIKKIKEIGEVKND